MQRIFICEDNQPKLEQICSIIRNYIMIENLSMKLFLACADPTCFMEVIESDIHYGDLYFLDIDLKHEISGLTLATFIRKQDPSAKIVFVTTHAELAMLTFQFKIEAMDYIIKEDTDAFKQKIISCVQTAHQRYLYHPKDEEEYYLIKTNDRIEKIRYADVLFISSTKTPHKLILHTCNRQVEFYGEIRNVANEEQGLIRCHRSYTVNVKNIATFDKTSRTVFMTNGESCPVSIRFVKIIGMAIEKHTKSTEKC